MTYPPTPPRATDALLADLRRDLPGTALSTGPEATVPYSADRSGSRPDGTPLAVVHAANADHVRTTLRRAHALRVPVVPRGAGSGLSGGTNAGADSVVLDLSRMNRILDLDPHEQLAVVEPGVITAALDRAAGEFGLRYAPGPARASVSTVGGDIATSAGGLRCAEYGVTRDAVLGLDVVLADGTAIRTGRRTVKGITGYDLTALLVGSEGTLGVITAATVRLRRLPETTATVAASFATFTESTEAMSALTAARLDPSMAELLDGPVLAAVDEAQGSDLRSRGAALLLLQFEGRSAEAEAQWAVRLLRQRAVSVETTTDPAEADRLLTARRLALPSLERLGRVLIEDIAVPRAQLAAVVTEIRIIAERHGVRIFTFAHAADGNLHPVLVLEADAPGIPDAARHAAGDIFTTALRLGGTLTGEHGVGTLKRKWLAQELGPAQHPLQQRIKAAFDPHHILNPGKAL
ncbi:FAD-binding oxidoreductase [Streptomyces sp. NPDC090080]|uniref:FAD-binding oxidoreductase n=1 Tax=Streptomyces sp. NPDC090080 TaxID=3365939 RepID=UPI003825F7E5